jgi:MFS family permease
MTTSNPAARPPAPVEDGTPPSPLFRNSNYRWLWASANISCLGDYFTLIAMPWLVLMLTKDPTALGVVMALESLPRAAFMLVSGGFTDRYSARRVLLVSRTLFMLALIALALILWYGHLQLHHLYGFAFAFGLLTAFALPASQALLPQLVDKTQIQSGNSALMGSQQLIQLFAPVLAGLLIWGMPAGPAHTGATSVSSIASAFAFNAAAIFMALLLLLKITLPMQQDTVDTGPAPLRLADGFIYLWRDRGLRIATLYMSCVGFFAIGPLLTVIPQIAEQRLHDGALSYGLLYAASGLGSMLGFACGGMLPKPGKRQLGLVMFSTDLAAGIGVFWLGRSTNFATAASALALIGLCAAYGGVLALSWIQERIPTELAGRVLGIVMFSVLGLTPVSMSLGGVLTAHSSLEALLTVSGCAIGSFALLGLLSPAINRFGTYASPALQVAT